MSDATRFRRRTVLRTLGSIGAATWFTSTAAGDSDSPDRPLSADGPASRTSPPGTTRYVAVVDRIVDDRHVVLLLEADCEVVDQLVEPKTRFDEIAEQDILLAVVRDGELLAYQHVSEKPGDCTDAGG